MAMRDRVGWAGLDTISAENTAVVVDVVDLGIPLRTGNAVLFGVFCRLNVNAIRGACSRTQETSDALLQPVLVALQDVQSPEPLLKNCTPEGPWPIRIILNDRRLEHLPEGDAHAFGDSGDVIDNSHMRVGTNQYKWFSLQRASLSG